MNINNQVNNKRLAIRLVNVSKKYTIHHEKPTLVEKFYKGKDEKFWALKNINLTINKGEKVGIIGPNGSGKTTLLKIITGITTPTYGTVETYGKIVSLIDLEAGFHPDLTGYQNIFLNGMLLGMKKTEIENKLSKIIRFADIHQFIDVPLFMYSSGMKLRLGFSIAIYANPDILILDENLSVGDIYYQRKVHTKLNRFFSEEKTIIFVSHMTEMLRVYCKRFVVINKGTTLQDGTVDVLNKYLNR